MLCPRCANTKHGVTDSRKCYSTIKRRRRCGDCDYTWGTCETIDGNQVDISTDKLLRIREIVNE